MVRIAVVEDDKNYADKLKKYLAQYQEESGRKLKIEYFEDGEDIAVDYKCEFDIILMDIEMRFMDGMTAAEKIREMDDEVVIIFITNTPQYAMKGYMVDAMDYVLKPLAYYAFSQKIDRAIKRMAKHEEKYLSISVKGGVQKLTVSRITFVEVCDHSLFFHTLDGDFESKGSMKDVENELPEEKFFRCNKCYLVNLDYVDGVRDNDIIIGKELVQVSRSRRKELLNRLNDYMNGVSR